MPYPVALFFIALAGSAMVIGSVMLAALVFGWPI
jgi:hypothetical protein